jgi:[acyl-carrier-protein] S-malonyltransferase
LFPGQGTQSVGMGRALFEASAAARQVFQRADRALGFSISKLCFEGPETELVLTANTQPAIVTVSIAALAALREAYPDLVAPAVSLGHSLGEYSALVAAGALELEAALRVVHRRGRAMQEAVPEGQGAMAAVMGGDPETVARLCEQAAAGEVCQPANYNAPGQIVIAGHASAVERASKLAIERKLKLVPLKVSAPFHCSLMAPAAQVVAQALRDVNIEPLAFPVVSNVEALPNQDPSRVSELLVKQVDSPVRWEQSVRCVAAMGVDRALEIGPGKVLAGLVRRIEKSIVVHGVGDPLGITQAASFLAP